jgi:hypothetical protein
MPMAVELLGAVLNANACDEINPAIKGPHRPDAIWQRDANFQFQKQIKPSPDKNFTRYADQIAKIAFKSSFEYLKNIEKY